MSATQKNSDSTTNVLSKKALDFIAQTLNNKDFEVLPLAGDASTRRYFRLIQNEDTYVLMSWDPFTQPDKYPFLNVRTHFEKHNVFVPKIIGISPELGLVLLEDLGDLTLERKFWENQNQKESLPYYQKSIDELLKIHYPCTRDNKSGCVAFDNAFDTEKLLWEMNYGMEHFLEGLCGINIKDNAKTELQNVFTKICETLSAEKRFICHRDFHSRNVMILRGQTRIIDFQDARLGPIQYDLVSLVHDSYVNLSEEMIYSILDYYLRTATEIKGKPINRDNFFKIYRYQILQRCFKACGSFASFYNDREDTRYLKYISPTINKVARYLNDFPEYSVFLKMIEDNGVLKKDYNALAESE